MTVSTYTSSNSQIFYPLPETLGNLSTLDLAEPTISKQAAYNHSVNSYFSNIGIIWNDFLTTNNQTTSEFKRKPINQIISSLRSQYLLSVDEKAIDLLQEHTYLISILFKLLSVIDNFFKTDKFHLTIIGDPENSNLDKLSLIVNTSLDVSTAFKKMQELDDRCLQEHIPNSILVHVEFI
jgi:hypothetical protein